MNHKLWLNQPGSVVIKLFAVENPSDSSGIVSKRDCINFIFIKCEVGYKVNDDKNECVDIDECKTTQCPYFRSSCKNTLGSYRCECFDGFEPFNEGWVHFYITIVIKYSIIMVTVMLVTSLCWWLYDGDWFEMTESLCWRLFSLCWWFSQCIKSVTNILNRLPISQTCHQHIWSPISVTNIDVTKKP